MKIKAGLAAAALAGLLAGCSSSPDSGASDAPTTSAASASHSSDASHEKPQASQTDDQAESTAAVITIKNFEYIGPDAVAPGTKVTVKNEDSTSHTVTADGEFDIVVEAGSTATFTAPSKPGEYPYVCLFHANMTGTLVVK